MSAPDTPDSLCSSGERSLVFRPDVSAEHQFRHGSSIHINKVEGKVEVRVGVRLQPEGTPDWCGTRRCRATQAGIHNCDYEKGGEGIGKSLVSIREATGRRRPLRLARASIRPAANVPPAERFICRAGAARTSRRREVVVRTSRRWRRCVG